MMGGKQPRFPLTDGWIKKRRYMYTAEYYLTIKQNRVMPFAATCLQPEIIILSKVKSEREDEYHVISLPCGI